MDSLYYYLKQLFSTHSMWFSVFDTPDCSVWDRLYNHWTLRHVLTCMVYTPESVHPLLDSPLLSVSTLKWNLNFALEILQVRDGKFSPYCLSGSSGYFWRLRASTVPVVIYTWQHVATGIVQEHSYQDPNLQTLSIEEETELFVRTMNLGCCLPVNGKQHF